MFMKMNLFASRMMKKNVRCRDYTKFEVITPNYALGDVNIGVSVVRNGNLGFVENIANKLV